MGPVIGCARNTCGAAIAVIVCNLTPVPRHNYQLGVPHPGRNVERFNNDARDYRGSGLGNAGGVHAEAPANARLRMVATAAVAAARDADLRVRSEL
jgi:1,4-alpha-glucan branching enzyme